MSEPLRHQPSSQVSRLEPHRSRTEVATTTAAEEAPIEPSGEGAIRLAQLKRDFPEIYFDACIFPPNLKRIPEDAVTTALSYTRDFYAQYKEWYKATVKASKVAFDRAKIIEKLEADLAQKNCIVDILQSKAESSRKAEVKSLKKVDETLV